MRVRACIGAGIAKQTVGKNNPELGGLRMATEMTVLGLQTPGSWNKVRVFENSTRNIQVGGCIWAIVWPTPSDCVTQA
jgi:hypothetical protein